MSHDATNPKHAREPAVRLSASFRALPPIVSVRIPAPLLAKVHAQMANAPLKRHGVILAALILGLEAMERDPTGWWAALRAEP